MNHRDTRWPTDERIRVEFILFGSRQVAAEPLLDERTEGGFFMKRWREATTEEQIGAAVLTQFPRLEYDAECLAFAVVRLGFLSGVTSTQTAWPSYSGCASNGVVDPVADSFMVMMCCWFGL